MCPDRNFLMQGLFTVKNKSSLIICRSFGINTISVCEVQKSFQITESSGVTEILYICKNRTEICAATTVDRDMCQRIFPVIFAGNMYNVLNKAVTLNDVKVHFAEKIFVITENPISLFHKTPDCSGGAGTGSIDRNDEFFHAVYFLVFQMFNEWHIAIMFQTIEIRNIVKTFCICMKFLAVNGKMSEKTMKIIAVFFSQTDF